MNEGPYRSLIILCNIAIHNLNTLQFQIDGECARRTNGASEKMYLFCEVSSAVRAGLCARGGVVAGCVLSLALEEGAQEDRRCIECWHLSRQDQRQCSCRLRIDVGEVGGY